MCQPGWAPAQSQLVWYGFESETQSGIESKTESEIQYEILWPPEAETLHDNNDHC